MCLGNSQRRILLLVLKPTDDPKQTEEPKSTTDLATNVRGLHLLILLDLHMLGRTLARAFVVLLAFAITVGA